jgi:signal transduction histidine kinase
MTDRLSAIGGQLAIDTAPGRGTRITAIVDAAAI